jgi:hypothetical protein
MVENNQEVAIRDSFSSNELREVSSFDEMLDLVASKVGEIDSAAQALGDGYSLLDSRDKGRLVGIPLLCVSWQFSISDRIKDKEFVTVRMMTKNGDKIILNDGSQGIYKQLRDYTNSHDGRTIGLMVHKGLRVSEYDYTDPNNGEVSRVTTYYLDTSYPTQR